MNKIKRIFMLSLCLLFFFLIIPAVHAEENQPEAPAIIGVYEYNEEGKGEAIFTLYSDNTFKAQLHDLETDEIRDGSGTYTLDGDVLTLSVGGEILKARISEDKLLPYEKPCKVIATVGEGGDVLFDIEEGEVGETVTAYIKPDVLFEITSVEINGQKVDINKDGKYEFKLVEGNNVFSATFAVSNEKLEKVAALINGVRENGISSLFTVKNLISLIYLVLTTLLSSGFLITLLKNKKITAKTTEQITALVEGILQTEAGKTIKEYLENFGNDILNKICLKTDDTNECMRVLCRCFVLAQDNTPQNRLAIIEELTKLNNSDEKLTNQIKTIIKQEQEKQAQAIAERNQALEDLEKANENIIVNDDGEGYGQL